MAEDGGNLTGNSRISDRQQESLVAELPPFSSHQVLGSAHENEDKGLEELLIVGNATSEAQNADSFWQLLEKVMEKRLGEQEGHKFCKIFQTVHDNLVNRTLSLDAIERIAKNLQFETL